MMEMKKFRNKEDFESYFKDMARLHEESYDRNFIIEGNSDVRLSYLIDIAEQIGYDKISVSDNIDYVSNIHIDVSDNPKLYMEIMGDEIQFNNGVIQMWFD